MGHNNCYTVLFLVWYFAYIIDRLSVCCSSRTWVNRSLKLQAGARFSLVRVEVITDANILSLVFGAACHVISWIDTYQLNYAGSYHRRLDS